MANMSSMQETITRYLEDLPPDLLRLRDTGSIDVLQMTPGSFNLNFHVRVGQKEFIFRVNIDQQSGLSNQIEYGFSVLKFLR